VRCRFSQSYFTSQVLYFNVQAKLKEVKRKFFEHEIEIEESIKSRYRG
jgi:hypothetical protein